MNKNKFSLALLIVAVVFFGFGYFVGNSSSNNETVRVEETAESTAITEESKKEFDGTINMNEYVTFKVTGYSGYGRDDMSGMLEYERFINDFKGKLEWTDIAEETLGDSFHKFTPEKYVASQCSLNQIPTYDRASKYGYSNGDIMKFKWDIDPKVEKLVNVKLEYKDVDYEVTGLLEPETVDVFEDLTYEFTGKSGSGSVEITGGTYSKYIKCYNHSIYNGEEIKFEISVPQDYFFKEYLVSPTRTEMTVVVEGLTE